MNLLRFLLQASRGVVLLSILAGMVSGVSGVALIALIAARLGAPGPPSWRVGVLFAGLVVLSAVTRVVAQGSMVRLAQGSVTKLCLGLCRTLLALPLAKFEALDPSGLIAVLTEDIVIVANALVGIPVLGINVPIVVVCLAYVGWLSPVMLACGVGVAVPAIAVYQWLGRRGVRHLRAARAEQDALVGHFRGLIDGFRELKIHRRRREVFLDDYLEPAAAVVRDRNAAGMTVFSAATGWSQVAFFGFLGFLLFVLPSVHDSGRAAVGGVVLVVLYILTPLEVILNWLPILGRARVSLQKIEALAPTLAPEAGDAARPGRIAFEEALELSEVTYAYRQGADRPDFVLGPLNLTLQREEIVFLVGGNGSGKTTLVKLLTGLYAPDSGAIRLDGRAVRPDEWDEYRQLFSVVFADGHLFPALLGLELPDLDERARDELARLELDALVSVQRGRFSTTRLSQGQKKRLALLTACLEDRPICVLDEWASHQDPYFKKIFYLEILPELRARGKTLVVISHDDAYFSVADRVLRLDSGRLREGEDSPIRDELPLTH